ncbi:MAG: glycosyltransferase family 2 protein [Candidatus Heimdallarchaeaceae archaeon]
MKSTNITQTTSKVKQMLLNVIIPVYGNTEPIDEVIKQIPVKELKKFSNKLNIYIIYTPKRKEEDLEINLPKEEFIKISIIKEFERGYGQAYLTGFSKVNSGIIATFDADGTYPINLLPNLIQKIIEEDIDFISINRLIEYERKAFSKRNLIGNKILTAIMNFLFRVKIKDSQSGMWVFKANILKEMNLQSKGMEFSTEIKLEALKNGFSFLELPGTYKERIDGSIPALNPWRDGIRILMYLFKKRLVKNNK